MCLVFPETYDIFVREFWDRIVNGGQSAGELFYERVPIAFALTEVWIVHYSSLARIQPMLYSIVDALIRDIKRSRVITDYSSGIGFLELFMIVGFPADLTAAQHPSSRLRTTCCHAQGSWFTSRPCSYSREDLLHCA